MFDGAELNGMKLEVREERFQPPMSGPFGSAPARGGHGGGDRGGYRGERPAFRERPPRSAGYAPPTEVRPSNFNAPPSNQIFVKNVSRLSLPNGPVLTSLQAALVYFQRRLGRAVPNGRASRLCRSFVREWSIKGRWHRPIHRRRRGRDFHRQISRLLVWRSSSQHRGAHSI
jgi:hypothetical protein